jgi:hypothetical protein
MAFFAGRARQNLVRALQRDVRLLLPADPGREQMLEYVHLFDPRARLASRGSINVDNMREVYLTRSLPIEPDVAAEADIPDGMGVAFFVTNVQRGGLSTKKEQHEMSVNLVNGLAVRLGGVAWPEASVMREPLRGYYLHSPRRRNSQPGVCDSGRVRAGVVPYDNPTFGPYGVSFWRTADGQFEAQHWPKGTVHALLPDAPRSLGDLFFHSVQSTAARLKLSIPANHAALAQIS